MAIFHIVLLALTLTSLVASKNTLITSSSGKMIQKNIISSTSDENIHTKFVNKLKKIRAQKKNHALLKKTAQKKKKSLTDLAANPSIGYGFLFYDDACTNPANRIGAIGTDVCLAFNDGSGQAASLSCEDGFIEAHYYDNEDCVDELDNSVFAESDTCVQDDNAMDYFNDESSSDLFISWNCENGDQTLFLGANYLMKTGYATSDCEEFYLGYGLQEERCANRGSGASSRYIKPILTTYTTPDCTGEPLFTQEMVTGTCGRIVTDDDGYYESSGYEQSYTDTLSVAEEDNGDNDHAPRLTHGEIAGTVIAVLVGSAIIVGIIYFCIQAKRVPAENHDGGAAYSTPPGNTAAENTAATADA